MGRRKQGLVVTRPGTEAAAVLPTLAERAQGAMSFTEIWEKQRSFLNAERERRGISDTKAGWEKFALQLAQEPPLSGLVTRYQEPQVSSEARTFEFLADVEYAKQERSLTSDADAVNYLASSGCPNPRWKSQTTGIQSRLNLLSGARRRLDEIYSDPAQRAAMLDGYRWRSPDQ